MTTATPVPTPPVVSPSTPSPSPVEGKKRSLLLWFVIGGLLLLGAAAITFFALSAGNDANEAAVVNDHSAQTGEPALVEVPGYAYRDPAPSDVAEFDREMAANNEQLATMMPPGSDDVYSSWSGHEVYTSEIDPMAVLMLVQVDPQFVSQPQFAPEMIVSGIAGGMATSGGTVTTETIDGESVAVVDDPTEDIAGFAWYHEGTVCMALGEDEDAIRTFVEAYVAEQNA